MKLYEIVKSFKGSQDGRFTESFEAGTIADLSDYLVGCIPADWVRQVGAAPEIENKAIITDGEPAKRQRKAK